MIENLSNINSIFTRIENINKKIENFQNIKIEGSFSKFLESSIIRRQTAINRTNKLESTTDVGRSSLNTIQKNETLNNIDRTSLINRLTNEHRAEKLYNQSLEQKSEINIKKSFSDTSYNKIVDRASKKYNVPKELIQAVIKQESNYNPKSISKAGAKGLMQLMPNTADILKVKNVFDPTENIMAGTQHLKDMINQTDNIEEALAAYNAGIGRVRNAGGIPNIKETQHYVDAVLKYYDYYKNNN